LPAVIAAGREPATRESICLGDRLGDAATRQGFRVVGR